MRKIFVCVLLLLFLGVKVSATEIDSLQEGLPEEAEEMISDVDTGDFWSGLKGLFFSGLSRSGDSLKSGLRLCAVLLGIALLCSVVDFSSLSKFGGAVSVAGALGICTAFLTTAKGMTGLASETVEKMSDYSACMLPVLASAAAAGGGMTAATSLYAGTMLFSQLILRLVSKLLIPGVYFYLAVATAEAALSNDALSELREFVGWLISKVLRLLVYGFLAFSSITGVISGAADAAAVKATRATLSGMVPVVGKLISDASETLLASASILKSTLGVFGMIAVLAICILPFFRIGIQYLLLKVTAAISGTVGLTQHVKLLKNFSTAMGYLLAMCGTTCFLLLISCVCFVKVVV